MTTVYVSICEGLCTLECPDHHLRETIEVSKPQQRKLMMLADGQTLERSELRALQQALRNTTFCLVADQIGISVTLEDKYSLNVLSSRKKFAELINTSSAHVLMLPRDGDLVSSIIRRAEVASAHREYVDVFAALKQANTNLNYSPFRSALANTLASLDHVGRLRTFDAIFDTLMECPPLSLKLQRTLAILAVFEIACKKTMPKKVLGFCLHCNDPELQDFANRHLSVHETVRALNH